MNDWFRSWHGAPTDNKWLVIARKAGVVPGVVSGIVWALFDYASQNAERGSVNGFDVETYAAFSGFEEEQIQAVIDALTEKDIIGPDGGLKNWSKRQPKREDGSAERAKGWRERQRNENERTRTQANASDLQIREDTDTDSSVANATARAVPALTAADEIWNEMPRALSDLSGKTEDRVRTWIGKVLKQHTPEAALAAMHAALKARTGDPFGYVTRILNPTDRPRDPPAKPSVQSVARALEEWTNSDDASNVYPLLPAARG